MEWIIFLILSVCSLAAGIIEFAYLRRTKKKLLFFNSFYVFAGSVFLAIFCLSLPAYWNDLGGGVWDAIGAFFLSIHNAVKLFAVDGDFGVITTNLSKDTGFLYQLYTGYASVVFLLAPVLTFGFVLSFFKNITAYRKYYFNKNTEIYIFSEANKRSVTLAEDLIQNNPKRTIVFTDYFEKDEEESYELSARIEALDAICFKKDINLIDFCKWIKDKKIYFFVIGDSETENIEQSLKIIKKYRTVTYNKTNLYTFSNSVESELLITAIDKGEIKVRRINEVRSLVNRVIEEHGTKLFENAHEEENGMKKISAVIVGMGDHGSEMLKTLSWYCQAEGFELEINAFDKDPLAYDKMYTQCPELLSEEYNGVYIEGEAQYKINIHGGVDVDSIKFMKKLEEIKNPTYVLVSLGSDAENIRIAVYLRMLFLRQGYGEKTIVQAVIYNSDEAAELGGIKNFKNQAYEIQCVGDLKTSYSENVIKNTKLEEHALKIHMSYSDIKGDTEKERKDSEKAAEAAFWNYEYNYRSSMASELHKEVYKYFRRPGIGEIEGKVYPEEYDEICDSVEHRRWNAYMRSEGYVYNANRNDLAKMHHNLVRYQNLSEADKEKDSNVRAGRSDAN